MLTVGELLDMTTEQVEASPEAKAALASMSGTFAMLGDAIKARLAMNDVVAPTIGRMLDQAGSTNAAIPHDLVARLQGGDRCNCSRDLAARLDRIERLLHEVRSDAE